jgi:hypothetical protein
MYLHIGLSSAFGRPHYLVKYIVYISPLLLYKKEGVVSILIINRCCIIRIILFVFSEYTRTFDKQLYLWIREKD